MTPLVRVVPPRPSQLAGDPGAPFAVYFGGDPTMVSLATAAAGLGVHVQSGAARVQGTRADLALLQAELERRGSPLAQRLAAFLQPVSAWRLRTREVALGDPIVMGILNLTLDSFSGDGVGQDTEAALRRAEQLRKDGADIIDVGAESARADRPVLEPAAEAELVARVVAKLGAEGHTVSSDTYKPLVAEAALAAGAELVNDISGLTQGTGAAEAAARAGAGYVLNYSYSVPKVRPETPPVYGDVVADTIAWMDERLAQLVNAGLDRAQTAIDPGIAFGKSHDEDIQVLRRIGEFTTFGAPLLLAHSRKNFIGSITGVEPSARDLETHVTSALAWGAGVRIFRVHDVAGARRALALARALEGGMAGDYAPDGESWPWRAGASATHMTIAAPDKPAPGGQRW